MHRLFVALLLWIPTGSALAQGTKPAAPVENGKSAEKFKLIHVQDLAQMLGPTSKTRIFDANDPEFRAKHGIIPGALLLTNFIKYDVAKELPADKSTPLVFYCANLH